MVCCNELCVTFNYSLSITELGKKEKQSRDINRSISTMVTQISNDSSVPSEKFTSGSMRNTRNSFNSRTKRIPSEGGI